MGKLSERRASLLIAAAVLLGGLALGALLSPEEGYSFPEPLKTVDVGTTDLSERAIVAGEDFTVHENSIARTNYHDLEFPVSEDFTSGLPLVILDTNGERPKQHVFWNSDADAYLPESDAYEYVDGTLKIVDHPGGVNRPTDQATVESSLRMRRRGNSSVNYDKHQYLVKLTDEHGTANRLDLLGMGADSEWVLNISFVDKSLLHNYLTYTAAGAVMPYVPDVRFCEVLWKDGDTYHYEGVYLLCESIKVSKERVNLPAFAENAQYLPFLLRRDRYDPYGTILDNYATREGLLSGFLDVKWPEKEVLSQSSIQRITEQVDQFERCLFAEEYDEFIRYRELIDMESFVDYLIFNEFFMNYDAGRNSTYIYSDYTGKLHMGPVWDFDQAMDNSPYQGVKLDSTAFHDAPWFRQILRDPEFTYRVVERYQELRRSILSDESIQTFIDQTVEGLGSAIDRDWSRWGYYYQEGGYLKSEYPGQPDRNTKTHADEVKKLKTVLSQHGAWMDEHLDSLYQFCDPGAPQISLEPGEEHRWGDLWAVVFVAVFFISVILIQRMERGD